MEAAQGALIVCAAWAAIIYLVTAYKRVTDMWGDLDGSTELVAFGCLILALGFLSVSQ